MSVVDQSSIALVLPPPHPRKLAKVPFAELAHNRLQGIVSSGSDLRRVYVSSVRAQDFAFTCRTNNNRPCGGAYDSACKHVQSLITESILQFGDERIASYLRVDTENLTSALLGGPSADDDAEVAASVFARFLADLAAFDVPTTTAPIPEMQWFPATTPDQGTP